MTDGERELGGRTETVEEINLDAIGREDVGDNFGEFARIIADVVAYCYGNLRKVGEGFLQIVGKALRGGPYGIYVHAVGAGTHYAAQTARAEFEILVEAFNELSGILCFKHLFNLGAGSLVILVAQPKHGFLLNGFKKFLIVVHRNGVSL